MVYSNDDVSALYTMERERTGNYGGDKYAEEYIKCPVCLEKSLYLYENTYTNEIVGCENCISTRTD